MLIRLASIPVKVMEQMHFKAIPQSIKNKKFIGVVSMICKGEIMLH